MPRSRRSLASPTTVVAEFSDGIAIRLGSAGVPGRRGNGGAWYASGSSGKREATSGEYRVHAGESRGIYL